VDMVQDQHLLGQPCNVLCKILRYLDGQLLDNPCIDWKMRVTIVCEDEREVIATYVSTYDMQGQSIKAPKSQMNSQAAET